MSKKALTISGLVVAMSLGLSACSDGGDTESMQNQAPTEDMTQPESDASPVDDVAEQAEQAHQNSQNMNDAGAGTTESTPPAGASTDDPQAGTMEENSQSARSSSTTSATAGGSVSEGESQAVPEDDVRANNETSNTMSRAEHAEQMNNPANNTGGKSDSQQ